MPPSPPGVPAKWVPVDPATKVAPGAADQIGALVGMLGKLLSVTQPATADHGPAMTSFGYDENRNKTRQTNARGFATTYIYDKLNRLEFAISNLSNQVYNTQDAESRIRDVDFAKETTEFTRSQILTQSATAMSRTPTIHLFHRSMVKSSLS